MWITFYRRERRRLRRSCINPFRDRYKIQYGNIDHARGVPGNILHIAAGLTLRTPRRQSIKVSVDTCKEEVVLFESIVEIVAGKQCIFPEFLYQYFVSELEQPAYYLLSTQGQQTVDFFVRSIPSAYHRFCRYLGVNEQLIGREHSHWPLT